VVDTKEDDKTIETIIEKLGKLGIIVFEDNLPTGDFLVHDIVIERKTTTDLWRSVVDKRWKSQRKRLKVLKDEFRPAILIEGNWGTVVGTRKHALKKKYKTLSGFDWNQTEQQMWSIYRAICLDQELIRFENTDFKETCELLRNLALSSDKPYDPAKLESLRQTPGKELTLDEWQRFILEGVPDIGPKRSDAILRWSGNLRVALGILIHGEDQLIYPDVLKETSKLWIKIREILDHKYGEEEDV